jgi:gamma-glutamyltranspeptidase/glutathione hydrolase
MKKINFLFLAFLLNFNAFANDVWIGEPSSGVKEYKVAKSKKFMISTSDETASKAGAWALKQGGNAVDGIIAAQLVLNVVEPHSSGIGGGGFLLYFDAKTKETIYFNGRETAPKKAYSTMFLQKNGQPKSFQDAVRGGLSVGTPGLLKILKESHEKYGKLPWKKLFEPAISVAKNGFVVDERMYLLAKQVAHLSELTEFREIYFDKNGQPKKAGTIIKNPKMAQTLTTIANEGIKPFYEGKIAHNIVNQVKNSKINPGLLRLSDLKNYQSKTGDLICGNYRKYKVCSMPLPSSGGITILQILGILENFDLKKYGKNSAEFVHLFAESAKLAYADRSEYVADVENVPVKQMLNQEYLKKRANLISLDKVIKNVEAGKFENVPSLASRGLVNNNNRELPSTTHLSIIDEEGNAIALTSSIEYFFGSGLAVDGFLLNNQLTDFSFKPKINGKLVANRVQPKKQPRSSMSPAFVFDKNDNLIMVVGSPGGPRIIQFVAKTIINHLDFGLNVQEAISAPNFVELNGKIELEKDTKIANLSQKLEKIGHKTVEIDIVSGINAISIKNNFFGKKIYGGADPRRQSFATGK